MTDLKNLNDAELIEFINMNSIKKKNAEADIKQAYDVLVTRNNNHLQNLLQAKDEPYGSVRTAINDGKNWLEYTVSKKVDWDQERLKEARNEIQRWDENPDDYIDAKYNVSETKYKAWPPTLKKLVNEARTVSSANPSVKITEVKEKV